jgi:alkanesulfonate monooxygenase SsuD/methylene tetrahydromethanopterin reductase-like flavin-dependent oxidoreductase (luciferase family)
MLISPATMELRSPVPSPAHAQASCKVRCVGAKLDRTPEISTYDGQRSNLERMKTFAEQGLTIREIAHRLINAGAVPSVIGTPTDVVDQLEARSKADAADGFNLMFPLLPEDWILFTTLVVPQLQRCGLAQTEYRGAHCEIASA